MDDTILILSIVAKRKSAAYRESLGSLAPFALIVVSHGAQNGDGVNAERSAS